MNTSRKYMKVAVACESEIGSVVGNYIVSVKGGSAVDGAIAAQLCNGIINLHSSGIGGDCFMVVYEKCSGRVYVFDGRGTAPEESNGHSLNWKSGVGSITVPSEISVFYSAWKRFGKLPWKELFDAAISLCENGFLIAPALGMTLQESEKDVLASVSLREMFFDPIRNCLLSVGDRVKNPPLGKTLRKIADDPTTFYDGELAQEIVSEINEAGGVLTLNDLSTYTTIETSAIKMVLRNSKKIIHGCGPPSSGHLVGLILGVMDGFGFIPDIKNNVTSMALFYHRFLEACKFAFAVRGSIGDKNFVGEETLKLIESLESQEYADKIRAMINDDRTFDASHYGTQFANVEDSGTSHLSLMSVDGDAVSLTSSINMNFGAMIRGAKTGIIHNNSLGDFSIPSSSCVFSLKPSPFNYLEPRKRPMSSMVPTIVTNLNGEAELIIGASGGPSILTSIALVISRILYLGENIKEAVDTPRVHHQLSPNAIRIDENFPEPIIQVFKEKGHVVERNPYCGVVQVVSLTNGCLEAECDFRKGGHPSGN